MKNLIKVERARRDMSQQDVADALNITRQAITAMEKNRFTPSMLMGLKIARLFNLKVEDIFILEEFEKQSITPVPLPEWQRTIPNC